MKYIIIVITMIIVKNGTINAQNILTIQINSLRNSKGRIVLELRDSSNKIIDSCIKNITEKKCIIIFRDIKAGKYSFKYFHDENNNLELETNFIGVPIEGYGFSNNAKGLFGPPEFEDTIFDINKDVIQKCKPTYIWD